MMADDPITDSLNPFPDRDGSDREARIRQRAFDIWQAEGMPEGREKEHWTAAEREVLMAEAEPSLGTPLTAGGDIPNIRSVSSAGVPAAQHDGSGDEPFEAPESPMTAGAPKPGSDTSKSPVANRDVEGPRKAGAMPRPTRKPGTGV
jgi:hypothetical protein